MNDNSNLLQRQYELEYDEVSFDDLENKLESELQDQISDLEILKEDHEKIGNPDTLGETVMNVVWDQFINQVGVVAGEDFIRENRGLKLDLRDSEHIQTAKNFADGKIASHNYISRKRLEKNYDRYKNKPHGVFRDEYVDPGMDATLKRAGALKKEGIDTVKDIYTGRQIPTQTKLENGKNNPKAAQREHVKSSSELYQNPSLQMANSNEELAAIINDPENLQGYTTAERNNRKSDNSFEEMDGRDKNKHWEKADKRAKEFIEQKEREGEERLKSEGRKTQKEEAFRIGKEALRSVIMGLFVSLIKDIIQKLITWFRIGSRKLATFIAAVKDAIRSFLFNIKEHLLNAGNALLTTIATAILGPVVSTIKKAWIFLKQGYESVKNAIKFLKDPANRNMPFSIKMLQVGKIIIAGFTAGGAILLGETIEKGLMAIPVFAFNIPLFGSLASILGMFFGALVSGIIGAFALNLIDKVIAKKTKTINEGQQIEKRNTIIQVQDELIAVTQKQVENKKYEVAVDMAKRHQQAGIVFENIGNKIIENTNQSDKIHKENNDKLDDIFDALNKIGK